MDARGVGSARFRSAAAIAAGFLTVALCVTVGRAAGASTMTALPSGFGSIAVDPVNSHVFVSSPTSNTISVLDFSGSLLQTISGESGAGNMTVYNGSLYVALPAGIDVFDASTLTRTGTLASGQLSSPGPLVEAGGKLWTSTGACGSWSTQLASVDPTTGLVTTWTPPTSTYLGYCVGLAASPYNPNLLLAWDLGNDPANITELDVSTGTPVVVASVRESDQANLQQISFNPDGTTFVTASGAPYQFEEFRLSDLSLDGVVYPAAPYPVSVVTTSQRNGLVIGASGSANSVYTYHPGETGQDLFNPSLGSLDPYDRGLALSPDASELFVVGQDSSGATYFDVLPVAGPTTTALATSAPNVPTGSPVTFTATVTGDSGWPSATGSVTFSQSGNKLATVSLVNGQATFTTSWSTAGRYDVVASYGGDQNNQPSSADYQEEVGTITSTSLSGSPNPAVSGEPVTLTATISGSAPTGTVTFYDGNGPAAPTVLGTVAVQNSGASLTTSSLAVGTHNITASYSGDSQNLSSGSNTLSEVINSNQAPTSTQLTSSATTVTAGQPVTFTATVTSSSSSGVSGLTGQMTFQLVSTAAGNVLGAATVTNGQASFTTNSLPGGTEQVEAVYSGNQYFASSTSNSVTETVNPAASTTTLATSVNPATAGESVTLTATVSAAGAPVSGTVTFLDGAATLAVEQVSGGQASFTTDFPAGTHTLSASFSGSSSDQASSSAPVSETVNPAPTTTALTSSANPAKAKNPVTFTATVTPSTQAFTLTGTVTFYYGSKVLATVALSGSLTATFTTSSLPVGYDTITAVYNGNPNFAGSQAKLVEQIKH